MGRRLLNRLGMDVGDRFTLVFSTSLGALRGYTFTVVGAFESGLHTSTTAKCSSH